MTTKRICIEIQEAVEAPTGAILHLSGELTSECIKSITGAFDSLIRQGKTFVIADMDGVTLISSAVLGEFMGCRRRLVEHDGELVFSGLSLELHSQLNLMGATKIFRICTDIRSALNYYRWEIERRPETISVSFPPSLKLVPPLRQLVSRISRQKGYGHRDSFRIETIVDEICNNAVEHGIPGASDPVDLSVTIDPDKIEIDIRNASDPEKAASLTAMLLPDNGEMDRLKPDVRRGRGLTLIKMLSDELSVDCTSRGTSVHVKKIREE